MLKETADFRKANVRYNSSSNSNSTRKYFMNINHLNDFIFNKFKEKNILRIYLTLTLSIILNRILSNRINENIEPVTNTQAK